VNVPSEVKYVEQLTASPSFLDPAENTNDQNIPISSVNVDKVSNTSKELGPKESTIIYPEKITSSMNASITHDVSTSSVNKVSKVGSVENVQTGVLESLSALLLTEAPVAVKLIKDQESVNPKESSVVKTEAAEIVSPDISEDSEVLSTVQPEALLEVVSSSTESQSTLISSVEDNNIVESTQDAMSMSSPPESIGYAQQEGQTKEPVPASITKSPISSKIVKESLIVTAYEDVALPSPIVLPDKEPIHLEPSRSKLLKGLSTTVKGSVVAYLPKLNKRESPF